MAFLIYSLSIYWVVYLQSTFFSPFSGRIPQLLIMSLCLFYFVLPQLCRLNIAFQERNGIGSEAAVWWKHNWQTVFSRVNSFWFWNRLRHIVFCASLIIVANTVKVAVASICAIDLRNCTPVLHNLSSEIIFWFLLVSTVSKFIISGDSILVIFKLDLARDLMDECTKKGILKRICIRVPCDRRTISESQLFLTLHTQVDWIQICFRWERWPGCKPVKIVWTDSEQIWNWRMMANLLKHYLSTIL